ncbi:MAG: endonuclease NucS [Aigarchaeota archaeon]|nr:endonuclease NucS [Candidatus Pelearchaeum maunauluense]
MFSIDDIREAVKRKSMLIIVGRCRVEYEGRAASHLGEGERLVIIKEDGSILVHRPVGYEPVNWNPPNSKLDISEEDGELVITSMRSGERLEIRLSEIKHFASFDLVDDAEFEMYASEAEMKKAVLADPSLIEDGFKPVEDERQAFGSGRIDIFGVDLSGRFVIVELKRKEANTQDINQLLSYVESLERELGSRPRAIIAAPSISRQATKIVAQAGVEFRCLTPRRCMEVLRRKKGLDAFLKER